MSAFAPEVARFVAECFSDVDAGQILDVHTHLLGLGTNDSGCFVNDRMNDIWQHPINVAKKLIFLSAGGVTGREPDCDMKYALHLATLQRGLHDPTDSNHHAKCMVFAFDQCYDEAGNVMPEKTSFHVPNEWSYRLSQLYPDVFLPVASIHPYRHDAVAELERNHQLGVKMVKWLPNSMNIDMLHPKCQPFYQRMKELGMVLLTHVGFEHSVDVGFLDNALGNPLRLRAALDAGVKTIAAHCASEGHDEDLDCICAMGGPHSHIESHTHPSVSSFELFLRLMDEQKYEGLLFGDISAITGIKRVGVLQKILDRTDLHPRLLYGTDHPVPNVSFVTSTLQMFAAGLITWTQRRHLNVIFRTNPLLYDFCLKRCLVSKNGNRFQPCVFQTLNHIIFK
jgi:hypothetical protein